MKRVVLAVVLALLAAAGSRAQATSPESMPPSSFDLGARLFELSKPNQTIKFGLSGALAGMPADWTVERAELSRIATPSADGTLEVTPQVADAARELFKKIENRLGELPAEPQRWRFRLGMALVAALDAIRDGTPETRKQAAFGLRELAFVNPPGFEVALVNEMSEVSDIIERGNPTAAENARVEALFGRLTGMFR